MKMLVPRLLSLAAALAVGTSCGRLGDDQSWRDQLVADSPCFDVNLIDGLDEQSTTEVRALFDCANHYGHLEALTHTVDSQDTVSRSGVNPGIELARAVNAMPEADVDPFALAGLLMNALQAEDRPIDEFLDIVLELSYGVPASAVRNGEVGLQSGSQLEQGVLAPLATVLPTATSTLLDDDLRAASWFGEVLADPETKRWVRTFEVYLTSDEPSLRVPLDGLVGHLGETLVAVDSPANDRWPLQSSGNSLRDVLDVFLLQDDPILAQISEDAASVVSDEAFRSALQPAVVSLHDQGHLAKLPSELLWMTSVDIEQAPVPQAGFSALYRFLRLLSATNRPIECELNFLITQVGFSFPNLAVAILELIAELDPDTVQGAVGIASALTNNLVADWMLHEAVDLQICPDLTHEVVDDLGAIDVLTGEEAYSLLVTVVEILDILKNQGTSNQIPAVANILEDIHVHGGTKALEEVILDLGDGSLIEDVVDLIPALSAPERYGITDVMSDPVELADAIALLTWAFVVDSDTQQTGLEQMRPLLKATLSPQATWTALDHAAVLMVDERTQVHRFMDILPPLLSIDPDLEILDSLGPLLGHKPISEPLMRLVEVDGLMTALLATEPQGVSEWVPLAFVGRLIIDGTLDEFLTLIDMVLGDAGADGSQAL
jgi:hypothetical protein